MLATTVRAAAGASDSIEPGTRQLTTTAASAISNQRHREVTPLGYARRSSRWARSGRCCQPVVGEPRYGGKTWAIRRAKAVRSGPFR
jgi:hypothetical protein